MQYVERGDEGTETEHHFLFAVPPVLTAPLSLPLTHMTHLLAALYDLQSQMPPQLELVLYGPDQMLSPPPGTTGLSFSMSGVSLSIYVYDNERFWVCLDSDKNFNPQSLEEFHRPHCIS